MHLTRFKISKLLSKRHCKDGDDSDGDKETYEDDVHQMVMTTLMRMIWSTSSRSVSTLQEI